MHKYIRSICPSELVPLKPIYNGKLSELFLEELYHHSLPGILTLCDNKMHIIEVGLIRTAIPKPNQIKKNNIRNVLQYKIPPNNQICGIDINYVLIGAWALGKRHIAFIPIDVFKALGGYVDSPFHKYFSVYPLEIEKVAQIAEQERLKKNLEMRRMLEKQGGL